MEKIGDVTEIKYHLRGKGVPKDHLTVDMFEIMMSGKSMKIEMPRDFKRIHVNRNSKQKDVYFASCLDRKKKESLIAIAKYYFEFDQDRSRCIHRGDHGDIHACLFVKSNVYQVNKVKSNVFD